VVEKAANYDALDAEKCKADFSNKSSPMKEFVFETGGKTPAPTCCSWLPTDSN
jgi:hypothetical protein